MKIHIELIPGAIRHLAGEIYKTTDAIKTDLKNGTIKTAIAYATTIVPETDPLYSTVLDLCDKALKTCTAVQEYDWRGVQARLSMLVTELTALKHGNKHGIGLYFSWCQVVIDALIGKD